jgi:hypothetical protein
MQFGMNIVKMETQQKHFRLINLPILNSSMLVQIKSFKNVLGFHGRFEADSSQVFQVFKVS